MTLSYVAAKFKLAKPIRGSTLTLAACLIDILLTKLGENWRELLESRREGPSAYLTSN